MSKFYLDLRTLSSINNAYKENSSSIMSFTGANTGNFAFRHALSSLFDISDYLTVNYAELSKELTTSQPEHIIVSCANWLCSTPQYEASNAVRADIIEKAKCSIVAFGLGAQASSDNSPLELGPNTIRLAKILSEKSQLLSVRDQFTYDVLKKIGINNAVITGCPSNFINTDTELGLKIVNKANQLNNENLQWGDLRIHFSEYSGGHTQSNEVLKRTLTLLTVSPSFYIIQSPTLFPLLLNENEIVPQPYISNAPEQLSDIKNIKKLIKSKTLHFSSIEGWLDFARTCELSVGMRIHGNMLPLQAGVPSIVIGHDSRTSGLSGFMGIPVISPNDFVEHSKKSPKIILEKISRTMENYDNRRGELATTMVDYLTNNSLKPKSELIALTKAICNNVN